MFAFEIFATNRRELLALGLRFSETAAKAFMIAVAAINRALLGLCCLGCWANFAAMPGQADAPGEQFLRNGDFEKGTEGWEPVWAREPGAAKAVLDTVERHGGAQALRIEHSGQRDWSLAHSLNLKVQPGEIYELSAWVRVQGAGSVTLGVVTRDTAGKTLNWAYGARSTTETKGWLCLRSRFVVPPATATFCPRLIGDGPATVWCDDFVLARQGSLAELRSQGLPAAVTISNAAIGVTLQTADGTFAVTDHRTKRTWGQRAAGVRLVVLDAKADGRAMDLRLLDPVSLRELAARARLDWGHSGAGRRPAGRGRDGCPACLACAVRLRQGTVAHSPRQRGDKLSGGR